MRSLVLRDTAQLDLPPVRPHLSGQAKFARQQVAQHPPGRDSALLAVMHQLMLDERGVVALRGPHENERPAGDGVEVVRNPIGRDCSGLI